MVMIFYWEVRGRGHKKTTTGRLLPLLGIDKLEKK